MDANINAKTKSEPKDVTSKIQKIGYPVSTEISLMKNNQDMSEDIAATNPHNIMCEAVGCYSQADTKVHVKVGSKGLIPVFLCTMCKSKLRLETAESELLKQENLVNEGEYDA
jgi:hypothetical protein